MEVSGGNNNHAENLWDAFKSLSIAVGILLFFIGWVYMDYYFKELGTDVYSIKIEPVTFYLYGFYALLKWYFFLTVAVYFVVMCALYYNKEHIKGFYYYLLSITFILFFISFLEAKETAIEKVDSIVKKKEQTPAISFSFKKEFIESILNKKELLKQFPILSDHVNRDSLLLIRLLIHSDSLQLRKLYESNNELYALYSPPGFDIQIFVIDKKNINYYYLTRTPH